MEKKIRILQLLPSDSPGIFELCKITADAFNSDAYDITTALFHTPSQTIENKQFISFNFRKNDLKGLRLKALYRLYKYCQQEKFDAIITHRFKALHMMLIINKFLQRPAKCISVIHGFGDFDRPYRRFFLNRLWDKNWRFVGISEPVSNYLKRTFEHSTPNVTTINNCIDVKATVESLQTKQHSRQQLKLRDDAFIFGTIGRLIPLKGHLSLIKAFKKVVEKRPNCHLIIIGEGRSRFELESYISTHNLQTNIMLAGHIEHASTYIKAFDVFVFPSLKEGFGLAILEAMAAELPVIASRTGGIPTILGDHGHLVSLQQHTDELANAMLQLENSTEQKRNEEGATLFRRLLDQFDKPTYQMKWLTLIAKKIATHSSHNKKPR